MKLPLIKDERIRKLGFRVWDKETEEYLHITKNKEDGVVGISPDGKKALYLEDGEVIILEDVIIEQDTGLKDKNGKEIYEGDIVEYVEGFYRAETSEFEDIKDTGIVVWNTEYSGFMIRNFDGVNGTMGECEVIGNIHENP